MDFKTILSIIAASFVLIGCWSLFADDEYYEPVTPANSIQNGDVNMDGQICIDDSVQIIYHLWRDGRRLPCPDAADLDRSGSIDVSDVVLGLRYLFHGDLIFDCPISCNNNGY